MTPHCYNCFMVSRLLTIAFLAFALGAAAAPVQTSALCAIAKWEDAYIDEWLDYHLGLGIDRIYVYDNSEDFSMRNKSRPDSVELVHFTASDPGGKRQRPAYTDCITTRGKAHTWVGFIDIDEFLVLKRHACVNDFLAEHLTQGSLSLNWVNFGTARRKTYEPLPVTLRFQLRGKEPLRHVKSFHRPPDVLQVLSGHHCRLKPNRTQHDTSGREILDPNPRKGKEPTGHYANNGGPTDVALIHHYFTKSEEEWEYKGCKRGRVSVKGKSPNCGRVPMVGTVHDASSWETLKRTSPKYAAFEAQAGAATGAQAQGKKPVGAVAGGGAERARAVDVQAVQAARGPEGGCKRRLVASQRGDAWHLVR